MPAVYIDSEGTVRSKGSGRVIAPAGWTPRRCRMEAALWAAAADALDTVSLPPVEPLVSLADARRARVRAMRRHPSAQPRLVVDGAELVASTAAALSALDSHSPKEGPCR